MFSESLKIIREFGIYLNNPTPVVTTKKRNAELLVLSLFHFLISTVSGIIAIIFFSASNGNGRTGNFGGTNFLTDTIFVTVILAPIIEELAQRLILNFKNRWIFTAGTFGLLYSITELISFIFNYNYTVNTNIIRFSALGFISLWFLYPRLFNRVKAFLTKNYVIFFYFVAVLFGLMHIFFFGNTAFKINWFFQTFTAGLMFGYIRNKYDIQAAILLHMLVNLSTF